MSRGDSVAAHPDWRPCLCLFHTTPRRRHDDDDDDDDGDGTTVGTTHTCVLRLSAPRREAIALSARRRVDGQDDSGSPHFSGTAAARSPYRET